MNSVYAYKMMFEEKMKCVLRKISVLQPRRYLASLPYLYAKQHSLVVQ
jgi:hypothetical protein